MTPLFFLFDMDPISGFIYLVVIIIGMAIAALRGD